MIGDPLNKWRNDFGDAYTERNRLSPDVIWKRQNTFFCILEDLPVTDIIEVGCNLGHNLKILQGFGYKVIGVEPNGSAHKAAFHLLNDPGVEKLEGLFIVNDGDCYNTRLPDECADLVLSSGLLIHVPDSRLDEAIIEMLRISRKYLLIIEYFSEEDREIIYRGNIGMLWKRNWPKVFERHPVSLFRDGFAGKDQGFDDCHWYLYEKLVSLYETV